jgi:hypothetical protein
MPRYFFHIREGADLSFDREGQDFSSLEAARSEAVNAARELIGERILHGGSIDDRQIQIADDKDNVLAVVETGDVIFRGGRFGSYSNDVTKSAPVTPPIGKKPPAE